MERFKTIIKGIRDRTKDSETDQQVSVDACWSCGCRDIQPSSKGENPHEFYYCPNCREHYINLGQAV